MMTRGQLRRVGQLATVAAVLLILWLTLDPDPPSGGPISPTLGHFILFFLLGATSALWYATSDLARRAPVRSLLAVLLVLWIFAAATELAQEYLVERVGDPNDWIANALGAIAGLFISSVIARLLLMRSER